MHSRLNKTEFQRHLVYIELERKQEEETFTEMPKALLVLEVCNMGCPTDVTLNGGGAFCHRYASRTPVSHLQVQFGAQNGRRVGERKRIMRERKINF